MRVHNNRPPRRGLPAEASRLPRLTCDPGESGSSRSASRIQCDASSNWPTSESATPKFMAASGASGLRVIARRYHSIASSCRCSSHNTFARLFRIA